MGIFDGLKVLDFGTCLATNLASMILADNGADVIRVEPPGGDPLRSEPAWLMLNRGKRSVVLDPATGADREVAGGLVAQSDVVIEQWEPDDAVAAGLDYATSRATNLGLIQVSVSAVGFRGPYSRLPCNDAVVEAVSGSMLDLAWWMERPDPVYRARPNPSYATANLVVQGITAALVARHRDGVGQHVTTSLYDGVLSFNFGSALRRQSELGELDPPMRAAPVGRFQPSLGYLPVRCQDGQWMQITNLTGRMFRRWMEVIGLGDIWDEPQWKLAPYEFPDATTKMALVEVVLARMLERPFDEWMEIFLAEGLTGDRFLTTQQALDDPRVRHIGAVLELDDRDHGDTVQLGLIAGFAETPGAATPTAPQLDEHRTEIVAESARQAAPAAASAPVGPVRSEPPFAGMIVLDFASWLAGPFGTSLLADLGARVIKIEPPTGDDCRASIGGRSRTFQGKESLVLDLKSPEGRDVIKRLLIRADAVLHNMRGDAAERLGIGYEQVRELNPDIVYLYAGSYGSSGPGAGRGAFHPTMGALSGGALRQLGHGNGPPPNDVPLAPEQLVECATDLIRANETSPDIASALVAGTALAMGLYHRRRTGVGQYIETTMLASNLYLCCTDALRYRGKPELPPLDSALRGTGALDRLYRAADGWLFVRCTSDAEWSLLCEVLDCTHLISDWRFSSAASRARFDDQLIAALATALARRTADEWEALCLHAGLACVRADRQRGDDFFLASAQSLENGFVVQVSHPGVGSYRRPACAVTLDRTPGVAHAAHAFGQDGPQLLSELGYADSDIDGWIQAGIVVAQ